MTTQLKKPVSLTPEQAALREQRMKIWRHNSFLGHCEMVRVQMQGIMTSDTVTDQAKSLANKIYSLSASLREALQERR